MGCPFHDGGEEPNERATERGGDRDRSDRSRSLDRRTFVKSALAIGGVSAIQGLDGVAGITTTARAADRGSDPISAGARHNRQHAWDAFEHVSGTDNTAQPPHSLILTLDYRHRGEPRPKHREQVASALEAIERNFEWHADGVLFTMAYSSSYFDRFDEDPPAGADPTPPADVVEYTEDLTGEDDVEPETRDAVLLLASTNVANVLAVEAALWGEDAGEDVDFSTTFEGVFEKPTDWPERRPGFAGEALPREEYDEKFDVDVPDEAPLSMGFVAGFDSSIPEEDAVTLHEGQVFPGPDVDAADVPDRDYVGDAGERDPGVFAQGTLKHLSHLEIDLQEWYDVDEESRRTQMYSPFHTEGDVGEVGESLNRDPGGDPDAEQGGDGDDVPDLHARDPDGSDYADLTEETAAEGTELTDGEPTVGHSQKTARARYDVDGDGELEQPTLRRDWDNVFVEGEDRAGYHFNVPMRFSESIFSLLEATYNVEFTSLDGRIDHDAVENDAIAERDGIAPYLSATRRGNFLVPPITLRALPHPRAEQVTVDVERDGDRYVVTVGGDGPGLGVSIDAPGLEADVGVGSRKGPRLDPETVRFGAPESVNRARGAMPVEITNRGGRRRYVFDADEVDLDGQARLFGKTRKVGTPVVGTTEV